MTRKRGTHAHTAALWDVLNAGLNTMLTRGSISSISQAFADSLLDGEGLDDELFGVGNPPFAHAKAPDLDSLSDFENSDDSDK